MSDPYAQDGYVDPYEEGLEAMYDEGKASEATARRLGIDTQADVEAAVEGALDMAIRKAEGAQRAQRYRTLTREAIAEDARAAIDELRESDPRAALAAGFSEVPGPEDGPEQPQGGVYAGSYGPSDPETPDRAGTGVLSAVGARRRYGRFLVYLSNPALTATGYNTNVVRHEERSSAGFEPKRTTERGDSKPSSMQQAPLVSILFGCSDEPGGIVDGFEWCKAFLRDRMGGADAILELPIPSVGADGGDDTLAWIPVRAVDYIVVDEVPPPPL